jgi:hypothetical protein
LVNKKLIFYRLEYWYYSNMNRKLIVGLVIATLVVVLVVVVVNRPKWTREDNVHYFDGKIPPNGNSADGTIKYLGKFNTQAEAEAAAEKADLKYYTWHDISMGGSYGGVAHGSNVAPVKKAADKRMSGTRK